MASTYSTSPVSDSAIFEPCKLHRKETECTSLPGAEVMNFATVARDISNGAMTVLQIIEADELAGASNDRKLFNDADRNALLRMAMSALRMLEGESERVIEWADECAIVMEGRKGGAITA